MEVSSTANNYQMLVSQQRHGIQPVPKEDSTYNNKEIYEASQGNLIRNNEDEIVLTPQGQNNLDNKKAANEAEDILALQAQKDAQRESATDYLAHKSMQSQIEIYLSVATDSKVEIGNNNTASIINSLRDVQKQNNAVEAYATYEENQNSYIASKN
ncbi:MAG: hypothetical protein U9P71_01475 [Campylobacterota bacterium]|nr:hypothetical protein [Campylobacterota bacterium]